MRISETTNKYLLRKGNKELFIEEVKNEKGERFFSVTMIRRSKTANGDEWTLDESGYKTIDRNNIDADLKKLLQSLE
ncbi:MULTISPECIES: hypothetical protein [Metallosphaera]|uniref:Uncharacterized protein n=3 Tax=Metallosphaera TaxID=41980 RepID=A4YI42_METS5|nr:MULTISPECIES: hypothetical protein [Metallosphaera]ABP96094.1 hypothetical protein Msed_1954 [Metallosphaera sedula DSM 5348]AIM28078.1 hypothetical protein HA72_1954 [Metallosphaera sedula]AKV74905.1 hypothetical protein MsedA_2004 [Metallosphaera sedula]AKV77143.1 hypothetical protein MsedB_2006 [Metallosphaera sedula]AKV79393.1 hypothetical protein MsedC_2004 [Metallosphaera sedula]